MLVAYAQLDGWLLGTFYHVSMSLHLTSYLTYQYLAGITNIFALKYLVRGFIESSIFTMSKMGICRLHWLVTMATKHSNSIILDIPLNMGSPFTRELK